MIWKNCYRFCCLVTTRKTDDGKEVILSSEVECSIKTGVHSMCLTTISDTFQHLFNKSTAVLYDLYPYKMKSKMVKTQVKPKAEGEWFHCQVSAREF